MSKKYYVVWKGAQTGVFDSWPTVQALTAGRADAQYMGFTSEAEAQAAFQSTYTKALMKRSLEKSGNSANSSTTKSPAYASTATAAAKVQKSYDLQVYCDGACSPNPGKSGTGMAVYQQGKVIQLWYGLYLANGTNNTAELNGMLAALRYAAPLVAQGKTVEILSDSKYSIDCIVTWAKGWQAKGWTRGKGEEIKNLAVIQECFALYQKLKQHITFTHVKGHANIEGNELADRMAVLARMKQQVSLVPYEETIDIKAILAMPSG